MDKSTAVPLRSLLFTPGDQESRIAENAKSGADALFLDIEEPRTPCPEATRVRARGLVREFLDSAAPGPGVPAQLRARAAGRVGDDPARPAGGDGTEPRRDPPAEDHRSRRRARGRRDPHLHRGRARPARGRHAALPDPRERAGDPPGVRDRDRVRSRRATWAARCRGSATSAPTSAFAGRRRAPRRCTSARRC